MSELLDFQIRVGRWASETFGSRPDSPDRVIQHLAKEVVELAQSESAFRVRASSLDPSVVHHAKQAAAEEAADCLLLLCRYADIRGFNLLEAARDKHEHNVADRRWQRGPDGLVEHVR